MKKTKKNVKEEEKENFEQGSGNRENEIRKEEKLGENESRKKER